MTDFSSFERIHFVGVGGVSMSALACIMKTRGKRVTGSDVRDSEAIRELREAGVKVTIGHAASNIGDAQLVVYTAAVKPDNPELTAAASAGIPAVERAVFLGYILSGYDCPVGVSGTHGKTTTTSMIAQALLAAHTDPTVLIGGTLPLIGHNYRIGRSQQIVYEACEYVDSFLHFKSFVTVILNIEAEHLDYFSDLAAIERSFSAFAGLTLPGGVVVANRDSRSVVRALKSRSGRTVWFSLVDRSADFYAEVAPGEGCPSFAVYEGGVRRGLCKLSVPGLHNVANALAAIAACRQLGVEYELLLPSLTSFGGACRRFDYKGTLDGVTVVDDYAHHPTEIRATLTAARSLNYNRVICVFQPHTFSRTGFFWDDFVSSLSIADRVLLLDIYAAREKPDPKVTSEGLALSLPSGVYCASFEEAKARLREELREGDLLITMGAGDVYRLGEQLLEEGEPV